MGNFVDLLGLATSYGKQWGDNQPSLESSSWRHEKTDPYFSSSPLKALILAFHVTPLVYGP